MQDIAIEDAVAQSGPVTADNGVVVQSDDQSDDQTGDQQSQDGMPDNPNAKLPDTVSDEISDDATVVSEDLAVTPEGEVKNIETGETVTDATLVGTQDQQPDPLAKTNGESFIPVSAEDVKDAVADANVQLSKFEGNEYGAHWGTYNNTKAFFDYQNNLFVQQAKGVIDVSEWQGDIDWAKAKADGVEGVIIRLGYGWGNNADRKAQRNISECKRLGIPFASTGIPTRTLRRLPKKKVPAWSPNSSDSVCARATWRTPCTTTWKSGRGRGISRPPIRTCTTVSSTIGTARCSPPDTRTWASTRTPATCKAR